MKDEIFEDLLATFGKEATTLDSKKLPRTQARIFEYGFWYFGFCFRWWYTIW